MKTYYLTVIPRHQFNSFYKFGYTKIPKEYIRQIPESIDIVNKKKEIWYDRLIDIFELLPPFEFDEEYLVLEFYLEEPFSVTETIIKITISAISKLFTLSEKAKTVLSDRLDQRIIIQPPIFDEILPEIREMIDNTDRKVALDFLWSILDLKDDIQTYLKSTNLAAIENGIKLRLEGKKNHDLLKYEFWTLVITYDRYNQFPNKKVGYFFDLAEIFMNFQGADNLPDDSNLYNVLLEIGSKQKDNAGEIEKVLRKDLRVSKFLNKLNEISQGLDALKIVPLFLYLKDEARKNQDTSFILFEKKAEYIKSYPDSLPYVLILLSYFFGYTKLYDKYYSYCNIELFKQSRFETLLEIKTKKTGKKTKYEEKIIQDLSQTSDLQNDSNVDLLDTTITLELGKTIDLPFSNKNEHTGSQDIKSESNDSSTSSIATNMLLDVVKKEIAEIFKAQPSTNQIKVSYLIDVLKRKWRKSYNVGQLSKLFKNDAEYIVESEKGTKILKKLS